MNRFGRPFRGGHQYARPENALKRSEELIGVGQKQAALQTLHETLTTGRRNRQWSATFETIMFRHIDLCCEMRKGRKAKEALQQYRNMCQAANVSSLEEVIKHFMKRAGEKAEEAQSKADAAVALDIEDLEVDATPEDIMLSYVSGEKSKDRTDRTFVTPWFRFLWETYRNLLDILRHNSRLEALYALTITRTFEFCFKYKRQSEFRRLCELLRSHLTNIQRRALYGKDQRDRPDLTNPETLQLHVDTRFEQLKVACKLELWQEAFRSVEDIINLVAINVKIIKPGMMEAYYAHLTEVFAFSDESILHCGYAWYKLFNLARKYNKTLVQIDIQMLASNVLLTALSVRPYTRGPLRPGNERSDQTRERQKRLANILGFGLDSKYQNEESYSRDALLTELSRKQFLNLVPNEIQQLYRLLEIDFKPLELCKTADTLLGSLENLPKPVSARCPIQNIDFTKYIKRMQHVAVLKMLKNMSRVYVNMKTANLAACVPFMTFGEVEATIVDAVKNNYLQVRIDHKDGMLHFGGDTLDSESFHVHISRMAERLSTSLKMIHPGDTAQRKAKVADTISKARENSHTEHTQALARKDYIERRKEEQEQVLLEKERAEERKKREQLEQVQAAEKLRRKQEAARREEDRIKREIEEREMEEAKALLGNKKLKEGEKLNKQKIMHNVLTEKLKEQQELDRRLQKLAKQMDHLERAKREEEYPFIEELHVNSLVSDKEFYEEQKLKTLEVKRKTWEIDIGEKKRLVKMKSDRDEFESQVRARRKEEFEELRIAHERRKEERRKQRKLDRLHQRRLAFIDICRTQIEEKFAEEEAAQKVAEEEKRLEELRKRREEKDRQMAAQRERDEEMERKRVDDRNRILNQGGGGGGGGPGPGPGVGGGGGGGAADGSRWGSRPARENRWSVGSDKEMPAPVSVAAAAANAGGYIPPHLRGRTGPADTQPSSEGRWGQRPPSPRRPSPRRDQRSPGRSPRRQSKSPYRGRPDDRARSPRDRPSAAKGNPDADRWERKPSPPGGRSPVRPPPRQSEGSWGSERPKASPPRPRDEGDRWERKAPQDAGRWERSPGRGSQPSQQQDDEGWQVKGRSPNRQRPADRWERSGPPGRSPPRDNFRSPNVSPRRRGPSPRRDPPIRSGGGYVPPGARNTDQGRGPGDFPSRRDDWKDDRRDRPAARQPYPSRDQPPRDGPPRDNDRGGGGSYVPPSRRSNAPPGQGNSDQARW